MDSPHLHCKFGKDTAPARWINKQTLECITPSNIMGNVAVEVTNDMITYSTDKREFEFVQSTQLLSITPSSGPPVGGSEVIVRGSDFSYSNSLYCQFCDQWSEAAFISVSEVRCVTPPHSLGLCPVQISVNRVDTIGENQLFFGYSSLPEISSFSPTAGPVSGGTLIHIEGKHMNEKTMCKFGSMALIKPENVSNDSITCRSPKVSSLRNLRLRLTNNMVDLSYDTTTFRFYDSLYIHKISPSTGPQRGGSRVSIWGINFVNSRFLGCKFGAKIVDAIWISETKIECSAPQNSPGVYFVEVSNNGQQFSQNKRSFTVYPNTEIFGIQPKSGRTLGGTLITVYGHNFVHGPSLRCNFNNSEHSSAIFFNSTVIKCVTTPFKGDTGGTVDVRVSNNGMDYSNTRATFRYDAQFEITSIYPTSGPSTGNTIVKISGENFVNFSNFLCSFGNSTVKATFISTKEIECTSPPFSISRGVVSLDIALTGKEFTRNGKNFSFYAPEVLTGLSPQSIPANWDRPARLMLDGSNFLNSAHIKCRMFGFGAAPAFWISPTKVSCELPNLTGVVPGSYEIQVSNNGQNFGRQNVQFTKRRELTVVTASPTFGSTDGGTKVHITAVSIGENGNVRCRFGSRTVVGTVLASNEISCFTPRSHTNETVKMYISLDNTHFSPVGIDFNYVNPHRVDSVTPSRGPSFGGSRIRVKGINFVCHPVCYCKFGNSEKVVGYWVNETDILCDSSPGKEHSLVTISTNGFDFASSKALFHYYKSPLVSSIFPFTGSEEGGTKVRIIGANFINSENLMCRFGTQSLPVRALFVHRRLIECVTPAHLPGSVSVAVSNNAADYGYRTAVFNYENRLEIQSFTPSFGPSTGGTRVEIEGHQFQFNSLLSCKFNDTVVPGSYISHTKIFCLTPRGMAGAVELHVSGNGVDFVLAGSRFEFIALPKIDTISPIYALERSAVPITVRGHNFLENSSCSFGNMEMTKAIVLNTKEIQCLSPGNLTAGQHSFDIIAGTVATSSALVFTVEKPSLLRRIIPLKGSATGGTLIDVYGNNFIRNVHYNCSFGSLSSIATWIDPTRLQCFSPASPAVGTVPFILHQPAGIYQESRINFTYMVDAAVEEIRPGHGSYLGNTVVDVFGTHFVRSSTLVCIFGLRKVKASFVNSTFVKCVAPPQNTGVVNFAVSNNNIDLTPQLIQFEYQTGCQVLSLKPRRGPIVGGTRIEVRGTGFSRNEINCKFGFSAPKIVPAEFVNSELIFCISPEASEGMEVSLDVSNGPYHFSNDKVKFRFIEAPQITHIFPLRGPAGGGTTLKIRGNYLYDARSLVCRFKSDQRTLLQPVSWHSSKFVSCLTPPSELGKLEVSLTLNGHDFVVAPSTFEVYANPSIESITPEFGPQSGGSMVTVYGLHFSATNPRCNFGGFQVPAIFVTNTEIKCPSPPSPFRGTTSFSISMNGEDFTDRTEVQFEYTDIPTVIKTHSAFGPRRGNTISTFEVLESRNAESIKECRFGVNSVGTKSIQSDAHQITCASPQGFGMQSFSVSVDGRTFSSPQMYYYRKGAYVTNIIPNKAPASGGSIILVEGLNFTNSRDLSCRFGEVVVRAIWHSTKEIRCNCPRHVPSSVVFEVSNNGVDFSSSGKQFKFLASASVTAISPTHGPEDGGTVVTVFGIHFVASKDLVCKFGLVRTRVVEFISSTEIICIAPPAPTIGTTWGTFVEIANDNLTFTGNAEKFTYDPRVLIFDISPKSGYTRGGSRVMLYGTNFRNYLGLTCKFGTIDVPGYYISQSEVECISPLQVNDDVEVEVSLNGEDFSFSRRSFSYTETPTVSKIWPLSGPAWAGGTLVTVMGTAFSNTQHLSCRFGQLVVPAMQVSNAKMACRSPAAQPGLVSFEITTNGLDFSTSNMRFLYHTDVSVAYVRPTRSLSTGQIPVFFRGTNFMNSTSLGCRFGENSVRGVFISPTLVVCIAPAREMGAHNASVTVSAEVTNNGYDYSASNVKFQYTQFCPGSRYCPHLQVLMAPNGTASLGRGQFNFTMCKPGEFQPRRAQSRCLKCPVGYICPDFGMSKPDLCPAGFVCQSLGLREPTIRCPAGHYCMAGTKTDDPKDFAGLAAHSYWQSSTTDNARTSGARANENYAWIKESQTGLVAFNKSTRKWLYLPRPPPATGITRPEHEPMMLSGGSSFTGGHQYGPTNILQVRHYRKVRHDRSLSYPTTPESLSSLGLLADNETLLAEVPFPCPIGTYCRTGATHNDTVQRNFSRPQRCLDGFFCPFGSNSPEGSGPCPTGFYCPRRTEKDGPLQRQQVTLYEALVCPEGMYCPGVGNTGPIDCYPGTYNPFKGQSNCTTCPSGHICPGWKRTQPLICPAGFVCMSEGLSAPVVQCPAGYFCRAGTFTLQPNETYGRNPDLTWGVQNSYDIEMQRQALLLKLKSTAYKGYSSTYEYVATSTLQPLACAPGTFCFGGVAHPTTIDWIPSMPEGGTAPQTCTEGAYCESGTPTAAGTGPCFKGHYCPPGSSWPTQAPVGNFANRKGSVVPSLCFPGTWAPLNATINCRTCPAGHTCQSYGTYVPMICARGTYRSLADSVTCRLCPEGTWAPDFGLQDISMCEPCPPGRMCGIEGMYDLMQSKQCPDGHVCGEGTNKATQFLHPCPAGYWCDPEQPPSMQYAGTCLKGAYCRRGTKGYLKGYFKCPQGYYCPIGTASALPRETRCPYQTITQVGASTLVECEVDQVDVCDKIPGRSYLSKFAYTGLSTGETRTLDSTRDGSDATGEVEVIRKILVVNRTASDPFWQNDTVDLYRSCPFNVSLAGGEYITIIGRNFQDRYTLACLFRPPEISFEDAQATGDQFSGTWESKTRLRCRTPAFYGNQTWAVHVSNDGVTFSDTFALVLPVNKTMYNTTDSQEPYLPIATRLAVWDRQIYEAECLCHEGPFLGSKPTLLKRPDENDDEYLTRSQISFQSLLTCQALVEEQEGNRVYEEDWFRLPVLNLAEMEFQFSHLPTEMKYGDHYRIAIYVSPSVCQEQRCVGGGSRARVSGISELDTAGTADHTDDQWVSQLDSFPCTQPVILPDSFLSVSVDKHGLNKFSMLALEDTIFKVEVHILHGLFLSATHFFKNMSVVTLAAPDRANRTEGLEASQVQMRRPEPSISWARERVPMQYIFLAFYSKEEHESSVASPLNLPPRYQEFERGRVLVSFKRDPDQEQQPVVLDSLFDIEEVLVDGNFVRPQQGVKPGVGWWDPPDNLVLISHAMMLKYRETFHNLQISADKTLFFEFTKMMLPYLPYFSNCDGFDSYIPIWRLFEHPDCALPDVPDPTAAIEQDIKGGDMVRTDPRRKIPMFPHQDDVIGVQGLGFNQPVADICNFGTTCTYEEDLIQPEVNERWFEAPSGTGLFGIVRSPFAVTEYLNQAQLQNPMRFAEGDEKLQGLAINKQAKDLTFGPYMGFDPISYTRGTAEQGPSNHLSDDVLNNVHDMLRGGPDAIIPVGVDGDSRDELTMVCAKLCYPRAVSLEIEYWQLSNYEKTLLSITLVLDDWNKDFESLDYEFSFSMAPLGYVALIIAFAFSLDIFIILFVFVGIFSIGITGVFYANIRFTTRLETPPKFRLSSYITLVAPTACIGVVIGSTPIFGVSYLFYMLLYGGEAPFNFEKPFPTDTHFLFDNMANHWMVKKLDPATIGDTRHGRFGMVLLIIGLFCIVLSAQIFLPKRVSKREKEIEMKRDKQAQKETVWVPTLWKRSNFMFASVIMGIFCTILIELSFWSNFGTYVWFLILAFRPAGIVLDLVIEGQLGEALLASPLVATFSLCTDIVTLGSDDFMDFVLCFIVEFGMLLFERTFWDPGFGMIFEAFTEAAANLVAWLRTKMKLKGKSKVEEQAEREKAAADQMKNRDAGVDYSTGDTVEPILGSFSGYSGDAFGMVYTTYYMYMFMVYRDPIQLPVLYGIKNQDMEYYLFFGVVNVPFQFVCDVLIHQCLEIFWGWKIYDYLVYTRYRYLQRETRWKGLEDSLDECIEEGARTLDQMCFSSQFYLMHSIATYGQMMIMFSIEIMVRWNYNLFGDRAAGILLLLVSLACYFMFLFSTWLTDKSGIYRLKHEDTAWHSTLGGPEEEEFGIPRWDELDKIKGASHEAYLMNQKITSETFRYKFLDYNRPWLVSQLPAILTPRTLRRSRPYLIAQLTKILGSVNPDVSSDSDSDDDGRPKFGPVALSTTSRSIARLWLAQARRRKRLREVVQPLINRARRNECEKCLSRQQLQVELVIPIEVLGDRFEKEHPDDEFDQVAWKQFFNKNAKFRTLCLKCIQEEQAVAKEKAMRSLQGAEISDSDDEDLGARFGAVFLSAASGAILKNWYRKASDMVRKRGGKTGAAVYISDDDEDDDAAVGWAKKKLKLSEASKAIAIKWLRMARARNPVATKKGKREALKLGRSQPRRSRRKPQPGAPRSAIRHK
jgi:hypothetical protein